MYKIKKAKNIMMCLAALLLFPIWPVSVSAAEYNCGEGDHKDVVVSTIPAGAETDGKITYTCEICGRTYHAVLYASDHIWSGWVTEREATCEEEGLRYRECTRDGGHRETEVIPALQHSYAESVVQEPACTDTGIKAFTCELCGHKYSEPFGTELGHHYVETVLSEPDCEREGVLLSSCERCGDVEKSEPIPAAGHVYGKWVIDREPNADTEGDRHKECENCGNCLYETIEPLPIINLSLPADRPPQPVITPVRVAIVTSNVGILIPFALLIMSDLSLIAWDRKMKQQYIIRKKAEEEEDDGYGFV